MTRIEAKQCMFLDYATANPSELLPGVAGNRAIIVVAIAGTIVPQFARAQTYAWAVSAYDVRTGMPLGMHAELAGTWPPFWDALPGAVTTG